MVLPVEKVMYQAQEVAARSCHQPLRRRGRRRRGGGGVRSAPGRSGPAQGARAWRAGAPHRQEGQEGQPHLALGVGRPRRHRPRVRRGRRHRQGADLHPAHPRGLHRDLRLHRALRQGRREAHGVDDHAGPHAIRTVFALVAGHVGLAEHKIRIISPDIGGGFGGKVPVYPGYVIAVAASVLTGKPVKWIEDRMENLQADSFARDYHITAELAAKKDGTLTALRIKTIADHGYTDAAANPSKFPAGLFHVCTGSYDLKAAHVEVDGAYTNKPPGGIAYRCSFRVTEAVHTIERMVDIMAHQLGDGPRRVPDEELHPARAVPYKSAPRLGVRQRQLRRRPPEGHGHASATPSSGASRRRSGSGRADGHRHLELHRDRGRRPVQALRHPGLKMFDSCEIRIHPTGKAIARFGTKSQGQGHETTYAQILAEELGIPAADIQVEEGDTDTAPYGLGTYASRSTPVAGAAAAVASRKISDKARKIAAHLLEVAPEDLVWEPGKFSVKGAPNRVQDHPGCRLRRLYESPAGDGGGARGASLLRPAQPHLPLRQLHLRGRHRQGHGRGEGPPLRRHRRLRQHHQPHDRPGTGPRRAHHGPGARALRGDLLRRVRQRPGRQLHRLPRCPPPWRRRSGRPAIPSRRRRIIPSAPRAWASRPRWARPRPSPTRWSTRSGISACATSTSRSRRAKVWKLLREKGVTE